MASWKNFKSWYQFNKEISQNKTWIYRERWGQKRTEKFISRSYQLQTLEPFVRFYCAFKKIDKNLKVEYRKGFTYYAPGPEFSLQHTQNSFVFLFLFLHLTQFCSHSFTTPTASFLLSWTMYLIILFRPPLPQHLFLLMALFPHCICA